MYTRDHIHRQAALVLIEAEWTQLQREQFSLGGRWRRWYGKRTVAQKAWAIGSAVVLLFGWLLVDTLNQQDKALAYEPVKYNDMDYGTPAGTFRQTYQLRNGIPYETFDSEKAAQGGTESAAAGPDTQKGLPEARPQR
jgi:hypothetical protein